MSHLAAQPDWPPRLGSGLSSPGRWQQPGQTVDRRGDSSGRWHRRPLRGSGRQAGPKSVAGFLGLEPTEWWLEPVISRGDCRSLASVPSASAPGSARDRRRRRVRRRTDGSCLPSLVGEPRHSASGHERTPTAVCARGGSNVMRMVRPRGLEPPRTNQSTRPSTLRVYQFRHERVGEEYRPRRRAAQTARRAAQTARRAAQTVRRAAPESIHA